MSTSTALHINYSRDTYSDAELINLYKAMLKPRMIEEKMLILLRQGKISKWFSGIGQEAVSVGATLALSDSEMIFPMHRNLGVFTCRNIPLDRLFAQWQGKLSGFTKGRDRSFHFGSLEHNLAGMISHLGPQLSLAAGVAFAHQIREESKVSLVFTGEGGTSEGEFHEALNVAAVWKLPVIFVIENNGYGLSTPTSEQYACERLSDRGIGYGMRALTIDGNNVLEVHQTIQNIANQIRYQPEPVLIECMTFRQRGHEEASGTKYVPVELMSEWVAKDPLVNFELFLLEEKIIDQSFIQDQKSQYTLEINQALSIADSYQYPEPSIDEELDDLYSKSPAIILPRSNKKDSKRFIDAISDGLDLAMSKHQNLILMGQDIGDYGGVFKITEGFVEKYGSTRVRNTPLCESAIIGIALGLSFQGMKSMVEMQFADFVSCGFNQIVNNLAKIHYRWGAPADVVIRMPCGGGVGAGPFHSQTNEAWFFKTHGLKIVYPSNPHDAKGLLLAAIEDPNPVMFFEHKALYRKITEEIYEDYYTLEIGKARIVKQGVDATIITYGMGVHWALDAIKDFEQSIEVIDLMSLSPLDYDCISESVRKTHRALVLHEDSLVGGVGGEIAAFIGENLFDHLDAPVIRVASLDTPVPFQKKLEEQYLASHRIREKLKFLLNY